MAAKQLAVRQATQHGMKKHDKTQHKDLSAHQGAGLTGLRWQRAREVTRATGKGGEEHNKLYRLTFSSHSSKDLRLLVRA